MAKSRDDYIREHDEDGTDIVSFHLVDAKTVERRMKEGDIKLPKKKVDIPKDKRWNTKQLNSKLLAGILNGDSIPNIAKGLMDVIGNNQVAATRNARTMVTGAENAGRKDSYKALEEQGVIQKKVWIATADDRTRESHLMLDGEEVDIDEPFSNGLMYPGDPSGEPEEVYNCRCTMRTHIVGIVRQDTGEYIDINTPHENAFHKQQIEEEEQRREDARPVPDEKESDEKFKISFTPAETIEEAERFAEDTFIKGGGFFNLTGKSISYNNIDLDVANTINQRMNEIYAQYNIDKLSSLEAYGKKDKKVYQKNPDAPFFTTNFGNIGMNTTMMQDFEKLEAYAKKGAEDFEYVMQNKDILSGDLLHLAEVYEHAGRALVDESLEGMITHELGHHISYMPDVNRELSDIAKQTNWKEYAAELSGYANHSFGEYVAESWTSYFNGETDKVQPELVKIFEGLKK